MFIINWSVCLSINTHSSHSRGFQACNCSSMTVSAKSPGYFLPLVRLSGLWRRRRSSQKTPLCAASVKKTWPGAWLSGGAGEAVSSSSSTRDTRSSDAWRAVWGKGGSCVNVCVCETENTDTGVECGYGTNWREYTHTYCMDLRKYNPAGLGHIHISYIYRNIYKHKQIECHTCWIHKHIYSASSVWKCADIWVHLHLCTQNASEFTKLRDFAFMNLCVCVCV